MTKVRKRHDDFKVESLTAQHIRDLELAAVFVAFDDMRAEQGMPETLARFKGYAGLIDGRPVVCGGLIPVWAWRAQIWLAYADGLRPRHFLTIERYACELVAGAHLAGFTRIEALVRADWPAARRWVERVGFTYEGTMRGYGQGGEDFCLHAAIRTTSEAC